MGMYRREISRMADQDRQTIIDRPVREQAASQQVASVPFHPKEVERQLPEGMRLVTLCDSEESAHHGVLRVAARGIAALLFHLPSQFEPYSWAVTVGSEVDRRALLRSLYPTHGPPYGARSHDRTTDGSDQ